MKDLKRTKLFKSTFRRKYFYLVLAKNQSFQTRTTAQACIRLERRQSRRTVYRSGFWKKIKKEDQIQSGELEEREGRIKGELSEEISRQEEEASGKETEGASREAGACEDDRAGRGWGSFS